MSIVIDVLLNFANVSAITLSGFMKIPQVYSLLKTKSPFGISLHGLLLEFSGYCIMLCYNIYSDYPIVSYLEYPFLVLQDLIMLIIMLALLGINSPFLLIPAAAFTSLLLSITWGLLPKYAIGILLSMCTLFSASSKVIQLLSIVSKQDSTGVSMTTWIISAYTCIARIFTIYIETMDLALLANFGINLILSSGVVLSTFLYQPKPKLSKKPRRKGKSKKKQN